MKTYDSVDTDVDALIMFVYDNNEAGKEQGISAVLHTCVKTHGFEKVLSSLRERNQSGIIKSLGDAVEELMETYK